MNRRCNNKISNIAVNDSPNVWSRCRFTRWRQVPAPLRRAAARIDRVAASWPLVNQLGDHTLIDRDGRPVTLLPLALTTVLEDEAGVFDFQLSQRDDRTLVLRLDLHGAEAAMAATRCRTAIENFAAVQGLAPIRIIAELGKPVPKGRSGKGQKIVARPAGRRS